MSPKTRRLVQRNRAKAQRERILRAFLSGTLGAFSGVTLYIPPPRHPHRSFKGRPPYGHGERGPRWAQKH